MSVLNCPKCCVFLPFSSCHRLSSTFCRICHNTWISRCYTIIRQSYFGQILLISHGYSANRLSTLKACFYGIMVTACCRVWANNRVIPLPCLPTCRAMSSIKTRWWTGKIILMMVLITRLVVVSMTVVLMTMISTTVALILTILTALKLHKIPQVY